MTRFVLILLLATLACRLFFGCWPWQLLRRRPAPSQDEARARALLGVHQSATREDIIDAHRRLVALVHPDRGGQAEQVYEANAARDLLLALLPVTIKDPE